MFVVWACSLGIFLLVSALISALRSPGLRFVSRAVAFGACAAPSVAVGHGFVPVPSWYAVFLLAAEGAPLRDAAITLAVSAASWAVVAVGFVAVGFAASRAAADRRGGRESPQGASGSSPGAI